MVSNYQLKFKKKGTKFLNQTAQGTLILLVGNERNLQKESEDSLVKPK